MKEATRWTIATGIFVVMGIALFVGGNEWEDTRTSYGAVPAGFGAVHQLLAELSLSEGRSFQEGEGLPEAATVWWIEPRGLCEGVEAGDPSEGASGIWRSLDWIERGGTAVIFLPEHDQHCLEEIEIAGVASPLRPIDITDLEEESDEGGAVADDWPGESEASGDYEGDEGEESEGSLEDELTSVITLVGPIHPQRRWLGEAPLRVFEFSEGYDTLSEDDVGRPVVVARTLGKGRVVLVATAKPLTNEWLDHKEASLFAVDLAIGLGAPFLDEREHGILPSPSAIPYLLTSSALPAFAGTALLALLALWWGRAQPAPVIEADIAPPPSLEGFVSSIAALYASTRDYAEVLRSYQEFALHQIRRAFLLPTDASTQIVCDRILASRALSSTDLRPLLEPSRAGRMADLVREVARIDALVERVAR